ncbi:MAG: class I SAM-dependent methyltransferase [Acidimicrobiia bacterium]|nr:class I SAM-dependent methyltransferase [Acidimicrobiia bacterium]
MAPPVPYYRGDLALVHHRRFGFHADATAPGVIALLQPVRDRRGLVLELGCGSGLLTRHLLDAGHRVIATDASPAMLELARRTAPDAEDIRPLTLPGDPLPDADAIVSVGHVLSYLDDELEIERALVAAADALRPGGVLAIDLCDLRWGETRADERTHPWITDDWVLITRTSLPAPARFVREMTTFVRNDEGTWRRDDERHDNILIDTSKVPPLLGEHGVKAEVRRSFGEERLPDGLVAVVGGKKTH